MASLQRPSKEARAELKNNNDLMNMMQLCDAKHCWLHELDHVPSDELPYWIAYYEHLETQRKREESKAKLKR